MKKLLARNKPRASTRYLFGLLLLVAMIAAACGGEDSVADVAGDVADAVSDFDVEDGAMEDESEAMEDDEGDSGDVVTNDSGSDAIDSDAPAAAAAATNDSDDAQLGSGGSAEGLDTQALGRDIIFTARLAINVDNVATAGAQATEVITDIGGFVFGQETQGGTDPRSEIIFKVRPQDFSEALESLGGIGELRNQTIATDDVTERVVDLNSRIEIAELGVERLRQALDDTNNFNQFAQTEQLLLDRESELEVMRGRLRTLRDQIDLATITLVLRQDAVVNELGLQVSFYEGHDNGSRCPASGGRDASFVPGDEVTLCLVTRNDGEQTLRDVTVTETALEIDGNDDLLTVFGGDLLQPGQTFVQAIEITLERDLFLRISATGVPTDGISDDQVAPLVNAQSNPQVNVVESEASPGFGDGFGTGSRLLAGIWSAVLVVAGFIIPLLVFLPFLLLAAWLWRRSSKARDAKRQERIAAQTSPPPTSQSVNAGEQYQHEET